MDVVERRLKPWRCKKVCYPKRSVAEKARAFYLAQRQRALAHGKKVSNKKLKSAYHCPDCNGWHLSCMKQKYDQEAAAVRRLQRMLPRPTVPDVRVVSVSNSGRVDD